MLLVEPAAEPSKMPRFALTATLLLLCASRATADLPTAFAALERGFSVADTLGVACTVAVYDIHLPGLRALARQDGAPPGAVELSVGRATTAAAFGVENPFLLSPNFTFPARPPQPPPPTLSAHRATPRRARRLYCDACGALPRARRGRWATRTRSGCRAPCSQAPAPPA